MASFQIEEARARLRISCCGVFAASGQLSLPTSLAVAPQDGPMSVDVTAAAAPSASTQGLVDVCCITCMQLCLLHLSSLSSTSNASCNHRQSGRKTSGSRLPSCRICHRPTRQPTSIIMTALRIIHLSSSLPWFCLLATSFLYRPIHFYHGD